MEREKRLHVVFSFFLLSWDHRFLLRIREKERGEDREGWEKRDVHRGKGCLPLALLPFKKVRWYATGNGISLSRQTVPPFSFYFFLFPANKVGICDSSHRGIKISSVAFT